MTSSRRRRRNDIASLIRNIERPTERNTTMGIASSIGKDGKVVNGQNISDGEVRDLLFALPYGISSSGLDGIRVQIITNDNQNNVAVGVIDSNKPQVKSGCLILYDKSGSQIRLNGDGTVGIRCGNITINDAITIDKDGNVTIDANNITLNGNVSITGSGTLNGKRIATQGDSVNNGRID